MSSSVCYKCNRTGHFARECSQGGSGGGFGGPRGGRGGGGDRGGPRGGSGGFGRGKMLAVCSWVATSRVFKVETRLRAC